jgi:xanthine dehydrogenase large subunit
VNFASSKPPLIARLVVTPHAAASIAWSHADRARVAPGIHAVLTAEDLGVAGNHLPNGEKLLASGEVEYLGQPVALIVADSAEQAAAAEALLDIRCHPSATVADIDHALAMQHFHGDAVTIVRGDPDGALSRAPYGIEGRIEIGTHFPLWDRTPRVVATLERSRRMTVRVSAEFPDRVRSAVALALGESESRIDILAKPLDGLCGGWQDEIEHLAALAALGARWTGRSVILELASTQDVPFSAKRQAMRVGFRAGFDETGRVLAAEIRLAIDGGHRAGIADAVLDQALLHADGAYFVPDFRVTGRLCRTQHRSGGMLPAEGAAQGTQAMEEIIVRVAHALALPPEVVRTTNFYREEGNRHSTPYGQPVDCGALQAVWSGLSKSSDWERRQREIAEWNLASGTSKRALTAVPVKFGVGDPRQEQNQALSVVELLRDGSVLAWLGCADAGDGLDRRIAREIAAQFGLSAERIEVRCGHLSATPHFTARIGADTAALMHRSVGDACEKLRKRLKPVAAQLLTDFGAPEIDPDTIRFQDGVAVAPVAQHGREIDFAEVVEAAWRRRENLTATGFHRTPNLWWDREIGAGWPFSGFVHGAAAIEVIVDAFTGQVEILRADLCLEGASDATGTAQERSQISRALQIGLGWMLGESGSPPDQSRLPRRQTIELISVSTHQAAASGAECAVFLAVAAREAVREALRAFGTPVDPRIEIELPLPATPMAVLESLREMSARLG